MSHVGRCDCPDQPPRAPDVHFADTRPHSPTTLTYEDSPHTSIIGSSHTTYGEAGHVMICAYCHLSFPICQLGSHNIALSHCFSTYSDATLNCPQRTTGPIKSLSTSSTCTKPATRSATVAPTQLILTTNHCERRYDYDPIRCRPTVVIRCLSVPRSIGFFFFFVYPIIVLRCIIYVTR